MMQDGFGLTLCTESFDPQAGGVSVKLSTLPLIAAAVALVISIVAALTMRTGVGPIVGWILTPFVVVGCLAWARFLFLSKSSDPWFDRTDGRRKLRILQVITLLAFLVSLPHIWRIGQEAALWLQ